jgi:transcriptional regulator with XRE-family HTH domain
MQIPNERLKREREQRGWSQSYLAGQIGVPDTSLVSKWERGIVQPSPHYREKLCSIFGKSAQELGFLPAREGEVAAAHPQTQEGFLVVATGQLQEHIPHTVTTSPLAQGQQSWAAQAPLLPSPALPGRAKARRRWLLLVLGVLLVIVALSGGALLALSQAGQHRQQAAGQPIIGDLYFESSGQVNDSTNQGIADEAQLSVHALAPLPAGQGYYAWLLPDQANPEQPVVLLGQFSGRGGAAQLVYSDPLHTNLLAATSQLLITAQPVTTLPPSFPPVESSAWRYAASIPQMRSPGQQYSLLDHLRHLLSDDPALKERGLRGGLTIWFYRNVQSVLEWAISAQGNFHPAGTANTGAIRSQVTRMLNYLDGTSLQRADAPRVPVLVDPHQGGVALLEFDPRQSPPGYLAHIPLHVRGVIASPGASQVQRVLTDQLLVAIDHVKGWLVAVYGDAVQLAVMSDAQLQGQQAQTLLNDMETNASAAFAGQTDPVTGDLRGGAQWLYQHMPSLATMPVTPYQA